MQYKTRNVCTAAQRKLFLLNFIVEKIQSSITVASRAYYERSDIYESAQAEKKTGTSHNHNRLQNEQLIMTMGSNFLIRFWRTNSNKIEKLTDF